MEKLCFLLWDSAPSRKSVLCPACSSLPTLAPRICMHSHAWIPFSCSVSPLFHLCPSVFPPGHCPMDSPRSTVTPTMCFTILELQGISAWPPLSLVFFCLAFFSQHSIHTVVWSCRPFFFLCCIVFHRQAPSMLLCP